ncbi:DUF6087 family protein [Streptomyces sp. SM12]|nr:DUF6087 family protein [Streptomyces sp. SM12]
MGKHRRPGPLNQPSRATPHVDPAAPFTPYEKRRRPPMDQYRRDRPLHGGAGHLRPHEPRTLEEWDGFGYTPAGTAPDLATAQVWVRELEIGTVDGEE